MFSNFDAPLVGVMGSSVFFCWVWAWHKLEIITLSYLGSAEVGGCWNVRSTVKTTNISFFWVWAVSWDTSSSNIRSSNCAHVRSVVIHPLFLFLGNINCGLSDSSIMWTCRFLWWIWRTTWIEILRQSLLLSQSLFL